MTPVPADMWERGGRGGARGGGSALLVVGTGSDAGKTTLVAGLCRLLARRGVRVAPFKAQNMANNSAVTADGREVGRAQALQASAAGIDVEVAMNPVLLKPTGDRHSQVVVEGRPLTTADAIGYGDLAMRLRPIVARNLADLRRRVDVVLCEGAGSASEINLADRDLANAGLARACGIPMVLVGDIERGGVFAALHGTWALLPDDVRPLLRGFLVNRFRGDPSLLDRGYAELADRTGVPVLGTVPWLDDLHLDAEDSLGITDLDGGPPRGRDGIDVAVLRWPAISNTTDLDALGAEPGVRVTFTASAAHARHADLLVLPGTKATARALAWLRDRGLDRVVRDRVAAGHPVLGICGGHQVLGQRISDDVEGCVGTIDGLGILPHTTTFHPDKVVRRVSGELPALGVVGSGYEIRHGRSDPDDPLVVAGPVISTTWHGLLEGRAARHAVLHHVAAHRGLQVVLGTGDPLARRAADLDRLADAVEAHVDVAALLDIAATAAPVPVA